MKNTVLLLLLTFFGASLLAQEPVNEELNDAIRKHGLEQSQAMEIAGWVVDTYGPRLTGSPGLDRATEWAVRQLEEWWLENVRTEEWGPFGRGWELEHFEMHARSPNYWPVVAYPKAWSASTDGEVSGEVIYLQATSEEDLKQAATIIASFVLHTAMRDEILPRKQLEQDLTGSEE